MAAILVSSVLAESLALSAKENSKSAVPLYVASITREPDPRLNFSERSVLNGSTWFAKLAAVTEVDASSRIARSTTF